MGSFSLAIFILRIHQRLYWPLFFANALFRRIHYPSVENICQSITFSFFCSVDKNVEEVEFHMMQRDSVALWLAESFNGGSIFIWSNIVFLYLISVGIRLLLHHQTTSNSGSSLMGVSCKICLATTLSSTALLLIPTTCWCLEVWMCCVFVWFVWLFVAVRTVFCLEWVVAFQVSVKALDQRVWTGLWTLRV